MVGPGNWIDLPTCFTLDRLFHMPMAFPSLRVISLAAKLRLFLTELPDNTQLVEAFRSHLFGRENVSLSSLGETTWWSTSLRFTLHAAVEEANSLGLMRGDRLCDPHLKDVLAGRKKTSTFQSAVAKILCGRFFSRSCTQLLQARLKRWDAVLDSGARGSANRAQTVLLRIKKVVPPAVLAAWIRSSLNGWCTSRRFQQSGQCRLHCLCGGDDSLEHYAVCQASWSCARSRLRLNDEPRNLSRFLGLSDEPDEDVILLVMQMAAVYKAYNTLRCGARRARPGEASKLIWANIRGFAQHAPSVAKLLRRRWAQ